MSGEFQFYLLFCIIPSVLGIGFIIFIERRYEKHQSKRQCPQCGTVGKWKTHEIPYETTNYYGYDDLLPKGAVKTGKRRGFDYEYKYTTTRLGSKCTKCGYISPSYW